MKEIANRDPSVSLNIETIDFDDFGGDLYPVPEATLSSLNLDVDKKTLIDGVSPNTGVAAKGLEPAVEGCQKFETSDISDSIPGRPACDGVEEELFHKKLELKVQEEMKRVEDAKATTLQNDNLPPELKCSICNSFFKEAVMIPCCQHSFCQKCIHQVLLENARCPKCFSAKCRIEDLLPNVSLRQAIEHFLESQTLTHGLGNDCQQYAPDGESGIQGKDISCGMSVFQRAPELPHSPSETGRGSNHVMVESPCKSPFKVNALNANNFLSHKRKQIDKIRPGDLVDCDDFQGESQPMRGEAESTVKKKREDLVDNKGGHKNFVDPGRHKKGARRCYMCGSPDHFVRDCPAALSPRPMPQTGNAIFPRSMSGFMPFWGAPPMPHVRPYGSLYGNCGMIPFNTGIPPAAPFPVPSYMSSMYHPMRALGCMRVGEVGPPLGTSEDNYASHSEFLDVQEREKRRKLWNQNFRREPWLADDENGDFNKVCFVAEKETSYDLKGHISKERSRSYSDDSSTQRSQKKSNHYSHRDDDIHLADGYPQKISPRDQKQNHRPERPNSEVDDLPCSSGCHSDERKRHHHKSYKKQDGKKEHDFCQHHPRARNENDSGRKRVEHGIRRHNKKHHFAESDLEDATSGEQRKQKKEPSQSSKHSKHNSESNNIEPSHSRWQMVSGSDEDGAEEYRYYKRKKGH
ncbi:E3 ubiquitin ligase PQT3-like isoform X2 [Morus notabilis]|uniref:E3 ubiquitin ligase PQT3-like isoform X2 n=1 Tax=Morus notabilis TaxID=981085 RepID=UPI000CED0A86|nr:E3 ubiquitin ligase PQT3-like isoform X2 [Morus notabilis]